MKELLTVCVTVVGLLAGGAARAADMPVKAPPPLAPAPTWTSFYLGGEIGGGWGNRTVTYTGNDPASALVINGGIGFVGEQAFAAHSFTSSGVTGGFEFGYNWQVNPNWVVGLETDINGSGIKGQSSGTSFIQNIPGGVFNNVVTSQQRLDWYGTVRARMGWLLTKDLLLFGTGGLAYGRVSENDSYAITGTPPAAVEVGLPSSGFSCTVNVTCFTGAKSSTRAGWTAGGGAEWRLAQNWTVKAEYLYVNLGGESLNAVALANTFPGFAAATYRAAFGTNDYHIVRAGLNWHW
jgi:outer membrane immunogenic protein